MNKQGVWKPIIFLFLFLLKNCSAQVNFAFDVGVTQSGIILENKNDVLLSTGSTEFPMIFRLAFPKMDISLDPNCKLDQQSLTLWKGMHERIIQSLAGQMHNIVMGNHTEEELEHFLQLLMNNSDLTEKRERRSNSFEASKADHIDKIQQRHRRSFRYFRDGYWLHSSWTEQKFDDIREWSENHFSALNRRIDSNGVALNITLNSLKNIEQDICKLMTQNWETALQNLRMSLLLSLGNLVDLIKNAKLGIIPGSIPDAFFHDFCVSHFRPNPYSDFCTRVNIRTLFNVKLEEVILGENLKIGLRMKVSIPNTDRKPHRIFRVRTVPVFSGLIQNTTSTSRKLIHRALLRTPLKYIGVQTSSMTTNFEGLVGFESSGCVNLADHHICFERALESDEKCLQGLLVDQQYSNECYIEHAYGSTTCISRKTPTGTIISSLDKVEIHRHNIRDSKDSVFQMRAKEKSGIFFLKKNRNFLSMVVCDKKQVKIEADPEIEPIIVETQSFNLSLEWKAEKSSLHDNIEHLEHQLIISKKQDKVVHQASNEKTTTANSQWENHFGLPFYHSLKLVFLGFLVTILVALAIFLKIKCYRCWQKKQEHEHHIPMNPTVYHESAC